LIRSDPSSERGMALVIVMFMVLTMSLVVSLLASVSRSETLGSLNYQTVTQTRYAAEAGISAAANYLLNTYVTPTTGGADSIAAYDTTRSPVQWNGNDVVLSSDPGVASNYPISAVQDAFLANSSGALAAGQGSANYVATARLMAMRQITDSATGNLVTLQTWMLTGRGSVDGIAASSVQVSSVLETNDRPMYSYAAFASNNGCAALSFAGGAHTDSYDSTIANSWNNPTPSGGNVGTNGNLVDAGSAYIDGGLFTPRTGVGACTSANVTAATAGATISGGITQLAQPVTYETPPQPSPLPPTTSYSFSKNSGCPGGTSFCTADSGQGATIHPPTASDVVTLGNVSLSGGAVLHLYPGTYVLNSLSMAGNGTIVIDGGGPVVFKVAGVGQTTPIDFTGGSFSNGTFNPSAMQIVYGGTGNVKLTGGSDSSGLVYAPNASISLSGGGNFYGAVIAGTVTGTGGAAIHYDRHLLTTSTTAGNPVLHQFTWQTY
jgi:hypothetical protein